MQIAVGPSLAVDQTPLASIYNCWQSTSGTIKKTKRNINLNANADGQCCGRSVVHYGKRFSFEWKWGNATGSGTSSTTRRQFSVENSHGVRHKQTVDCDITDCNEAQLLNWKMSKKKYLYISISWNNYGKTDLSKNLMCTPRRVGCIWATHTNTHTRAARRAAQFSPWHSKSPHTPPNIPRARYIRVSLCGASISGEQ